MQNTTWKKEPHIKSLSSKLIELQLNYMEVSRKAFDLMLGYVEFDLAYGSVQDEYINFLNSLEVSNYYCLHILLLLYLLIFYNTSSKSTTRVIEGDCYQKYLLKSLGPTHAYMLNNIGETTRNIQNSLFW